MNSRLLCPRALACLALAGCGAPPALDDATAEDPSRAAVPHRAAGAATLRSGARLSARAVERLRPAAEGGKPEFLLHLRAEADHALPGGAATASFERGEDGVARYLLNGEPATEAAMTRFAEDSRRALDRHVTARTRDAEARTRRLIAELGLAEDVVSYSANAVRLRADRADLERVTSRLGSRLALVDTQPVEHTAMTDETNPSGHGALEAIRVRPFAHNYNLRGQGIGVWLQEGNQPEPTDPAISASHLTILTPEATHSHPTATTSALQQTAPEAMVYYAHEPTGCFLPSVVTQQTDPPVYIGSHAWGFGENTSNYDPCDAQWDDYVYNTRIAMFVSSGNGANFVGTPGKAYNVNSIGASNHVNGTMYSGSGFRNPETGAMKPEFVAPGVGIFIRAPDRAFCPGCGSVTGTSIAAPIAAGFAADMLSGSAFFRNQPQALRAAMLAGATTNVEGAALYSSLDGAGQINFLHSYFYRSGRWWNGPNNAFFDASGVITESATLTQGDRVRVAISWLTPGSYVAANNRPSMEMTLEVRRGSFVRTSTLTGETFQLVDFTAPESGPYTVRIRRTFNSGQGNVILALSVGKVA